MTHSPLNPGTSTGLLARSSQAVTLVLALALIASCGEKKAKAPEVTTPSGPLVHGLTPEQAAKPVAKVGTQVITAGELADRLAAQPAYLRPKFNSPDERKRFLDAMVHFELMAQEAARLGLDKGEEMEAIRAEALLETFVEEKVLKQVAALPTDEAALREYFERKRHIFVHPAGRRVIVASFDNLRDAKRTHAAIKRLSRDAIANSGLPEPFSFSAMFDEEGRSNAPEDDATNNTQSVVKDSLPLPVVEAAFSLSSNKEMGPEPIEAEDRFYVIRWAGSRSPRNDSFERVRGDLAAQLRMEREAEARKAVLDAVLKEADIDIAEDAVEKIRKGLAERLKERKRS